MDIYDLFSYDHIVILLKLLVAALLGGLIGYDREKTGHPAGLRTHMIVCVTSTFLITAFQSMMATDSLARIGAAVMTGIGFLGAGTILVHGKEIHGLTTAATVWGMAGIGLIVGIGVYFEAVVATILFWIVLNLRSIEPSKNGKLKKKGVR
jgi:putative Mg2+ transporter-C (MgtC) family protein